jgi:hypothetical protein
LSKLKALPLVHATHGLVLEAGLPQPLPLTLGLHLFGEIVAVADF